MRFHWSNFQRGAMVGKYGYFLEQENSFKTSSLLSSQVNKYWLWQIFVQALSNFLNYFIKSKTCASTNKYSKSNHTNWSCCLASGMHGLGLVSEARCCYQLSASVVSDYKTLVLNIKEHCLP